MRATVVTNIPTPYRLPVYDLLHAQPDIDLHVVYMADTEPNRRWRLPRPVAPSTVLRSRVLSIAGKPVHVTAGVWSALRSSRPDVIVTNGFNPPQLVSVLYAVGHRIPHVAQTDGTPASEAGLTRAHRVVRRLVSKRTAAFVAAAEEGLDLMRAWGAPVGRPMFRSPLAVDNAAFAVDGRAKDLDLLFSGQLSAIKDPLFAIDVAERSARLLGRRVVLGVIGDGPLRDEVRSRSAQVRELVDVRIGGFQQQDALPDWYARARVFLFPTHWDPWGLVLNEALAAGVACIASVEAGSARELLRDGVNGFVLEHDAQTWARVAADLLATPQEAAAIGAAGRRAVAHYTYERAAEGLALALRAAVERRAG